MTEVHITFRVFLTDEKEKETMQRLIESLDRDKKSDQVVCVSITIEKTEPIDDLN